MAKTARTTTFINNSGIRAQKCPSRLTDHPKNAVGPHQKSSIEFRAQLATSNSQRELWPRVPTKNRRVNCRLKKPPANPNHLLHASKNLNHHLGARSASSTRFRCPTRYGHREPLQFRAWEPRLDIRLCAGRMSSSLIRIWALKLNK